MALRLLDLSLLRQDGTADYDSLKALVNALINPHLYALELYM
jgi:hypothetical protein